MVAAYLPPEEQVALTPTAHDLFDAGLWTIDDNLRIQVAHSDISDLHGRPLSFNPQADFYAFYGICASSKVR